MYQQLYREFVSKYSVGRTDEEFIPSDDIEDIVKRLEGKTNSDKIDEKLVDYVEIEEDGEGYEIKVGEAMIDGLANDNKISEHPEKCVTHGNKETGAPPEGKTEAGDKTKYGIR